MPTTKTTTSKPKLTPRQQQILHLIYRYRFITRPQLQALFEHKDKKQIGLWLKQLREQEYIGWIYSDHFTEKTKPAIYYLDTPGIGFLRTVGNMPPGQLRTRYRDKARSDSFVARCLLIADCCADLMMQSLVDTTHPSHVEADYRDPESKYHFLAKLGPHLVFTKTKDNSTQPYLLSVIDSTLPRYRVRKLLKNYVEFLDSGEWTDEIDGPSPIALFICPTKADMIYVKRRTRKLLEDIMSEGEIHIRFAVANQIKVHGVTGKIWEEA